MAVKLPVPSGLPPVMLSAAWVATLESASEVLHPAAGTLPSG